MKFSIKDFFSKRDQIRSCLRIWSHLLEKSLMENFISCVVQFIQFWRGIFIWKFKQAYVRFLPIFVMLCIVTHWNATVLPFSTYIELMMMMMKMNFFCGMVDGRKAFSLPSSRNHCQRSSANLRYVASRFWTCAEPEFRGSWMKLCSSDNNSIFIVHRGFHRFMWWFQWLPLIYEISCAVLSPWTSFLRTEKDYIIDLGKGLRLFIEEPSTSLYIFIIIRMSVRHFS